MSTQLTSNSKVTTILLNNLVREGKDIKLQINDKEHVIVISPIFQSDTKKQYPYRYIILMENKRTVYGCKVKDQNMDAETWLQDAINHIGLKYNEVKILLL